MLRIRFRKAVVAAGITLGIASSVWIFSLRRAAAWSVDHFTLRSVARLEDQVFATTDDGFYWGSLSDPQWKKLEGVPMQPGGTFASMPGNSQELYYSECSRRMPQQTGTKVWRSDDLGRSWQNVSTCKGLKCMRLLATGSLFAIAEKRVLQSTDHGRSWVDITHNGSGEPLALLEDVDHHGLIDVYADGGIREVEWRAADPNYNWVITHAIEQKSMPTLEEFEGRGGGSMGVAFSGEATLDSYFKDEYRNSVEDFGLTIITDHHDYRFMATSAMPVNIEVRSLRSGVAINFIDFEDERGCWSIELLSLDRGKLIQGSLPLRALGRAKRTREVDSAHAYQRIVDLRKLFANHIPVGRYRAKFLYDSESAATSGSGEWPGFFYGADFGLVIDPPSHR